jgi:predicted Rossmann fold nucleotide-binding protein DprA/Smf involved in DNA uptake
MLLHAPETINWRGRSLWAHGNAALLDEPLTALLCSRACPGAKIIEAMDLAQRWRAENRAVISGFHTAVEKECLRIFLQGPQPLVICPARGLDPFQLPTDWRTKYKRGEVLILSPFDSTVRRPTKETAEVRTRLVVELADECSVIHASHRGMIDRIQKQSLQSRANGA